MLFTGFGGGFTWGSVLFRHAHPFRSEGALHVAPVGMLFPGTGLAVRRAWGRTTTTPFPEARELYRDANAALGFDIAALSFSGDLEELTRTRNAQPAILLHSLVVLAVLRERGIEPGVVAGHSLGEFSALVAAGVLQPDGRAAASCAAAASSCTTRAWSGRAPWRRSSGSTRRTVEGCLREAGGTVVVANYNSPSQLAISGDVDGGRSRRASCARRAAPSARSCCR